MSFRLSQRKADQMERDELVRRAADAARTLTVLQAHQVGYRIQVVCECGHSAAVSPIAVVHRGLGAETWKALLDRGAFPCRKCARVARELRVFSQPELLLTIRRPAEAQEPR